MWQQKKFWIGIINILIIILALLYYNQITSYKHQLAEANKEIKQIKSVSRDGEAQKSSGSKNTSTSKGKYKDGKYSGSGKGYGGNINLTVIVSGGEISDIKIDDASGEDAAYYNNALTVIDRIIEKQSYNVNIISGATYSSRGIKNAVKQALGKAEK